METKDNSGAIFKNDKKTKDTQPDYQGKIIVDGTEKQISLWVKEAKSGLKYFSASIQDPYKKPSDTLKDDVVKDDLPF